MVIAHIHTEDFAFLDDMLVALRDCFVPRAAGATARADFRVAKQKTGEDIIAWHTRCRSLFHHAYPTGCITTSLELKQRSVKA